MTTWTNNTAGTKRYTTKHGKFKKHTWIIPGIKGNDGGTVTTQLNKILNTTITTESTPGGTPCSSLTWRVSGKTVVVAYTDPTDTHVVHVSVLGA